MRWEVIPGTINRSKNLWLNMKNLLLIILRQENSIITNLDDIAMPIDKCIPKHLSEKMLIVYGN